MSHGQPRRVNHSIMMTNRFHQSAKQLTVGHMTIACMSCALMKARVTKCNNAVDKPYKILTASLYTSVSMKFRNLFASTMQYKEQALVL